MVQGRGEGGCKADSVEIGVRMMCSPRSLSGGLGYYPAIEEKSSFATGNISIYDDFSR